MQKVRACFPAEATRSFKDGGLPEELACIPFCHLYSFSFPSSFFFAAHLLLIPLLPAAQVWGALREGHQKRTGALQQHLGQWVVAAGPSTCVAY